MSSKHTVEHESLRIDLLRIVFSSNPTSELTGRGDCIKLRRTKQVEKEAIRAPVQKFCYAVG